MLNYGLKNGNIVFSKIYTFVEWKSSKNGVFTDILFSGIMNKLLTTETGIDKVLQPVSRFSCGNCSDEKQSVIEKFLEFSEKYFGLV